MSRKFTPVLLFLCAISLTCSDAYSELTQARDTAISSRDVMSAWTQPKGRIYNQLYYSYHESENKFSSIEFHSVEREPSGFLVSTNRDAEKVETEKFTADTVTYHGEYGITDDVTVFTNIPWIDTRYGEVMNNSDEAGPSGIGDIKVGLRYNLAKDLLYSDALMSVQGSVKIPEAYEYKHPLTEVSLGDGQYDMSLDVLLGKEWDKGYVLLNAGYTYRFENEEHDPLNFKPSDQIRVLMGGAYSIIPKLYLKGTVDWRKSVGNATVSDDMVIFNMALGGPMSEDDTILIKDTLGLEQDILNLGIGLAYEINQSVQAIMQYNTDIEGIDNFGTMDAAQLTTYTLALVLMF